MNSVVSINLSDLVPPGRGAVIEDGTDQGPQEASAYKIPPVIWMVIFLTVGYLGVRMLMED